MKRISKKDIMLIIVLLICLTLIYKLPKLLINKNNQEIPEVKLKEIKDRKSFAIMVPNENGDDYVEYTEDTWPSDGYKYKEAKCINNNGEIVENAITFDSETKTVILETDKTVACTLYFDALPKEIYINLSSKPENFETEYRDKIKQIEFVNYIETDDATASWDFSDTQNGTKSGSVMGWVKPMVDDNEHYILYIGCTKEKIKAKILDNGFYGMAVLESINFNDMLDTSETTSMQSLFRNCNNLKKLNSITNWDVSSVFYDLDQYDGVSNMFTGSGIESIDLSGWNKYFSLQLIFSGSNLKEINLSNWDIHINHFITGTGTADESVFDTSSFPTSVEKLILNNTNFLIEDNRSNPYNFSYTGALSGLKNLKEIYLNGAKLASSYIDEFGLFQQCPNLMKVEMKNAKINMTTLNRMFYASTKLEEIDLTGTDTSYINNFGYMFGNCTSIKTIHFDNFAHSNATSSSSYQYMFYNIPKTATIYVPTNEVSWIKSRLSESSRSSVTVIGV